MSEIPRRRVLTALALGLTTAAGCGTGTYRGSQRTLRIATGQRGEVNLAFVELLATEIRHEEPRLRVTAIPSEGSLENLQHLRAGQADLALVLADVAQAAVTSDGPPRLRCRCGPSAGSIRTIFISSSWLPALSIPWLTWPGAQSLRVRTVLLPG